jgi:acyl dehydratase
MTRIDESFDPSAHLCARQRWFEDFAVGERYVLPSRTVTDADFAAFRTVSGDNHPIHYDAEYCRARGLPGLLAHGLQVVCFAAAGAGQFPHETSDSLVAFLEQSSKFLGPVVEGDTLYPALEIVELTPQRTTGVIVMSATIHNQRRELVMTGEHRYLVKKRP